MDFAGLVAVVACVFAIGTTAQAVTGFGCALVTVPLLTLLIGPSRAVIVTVAVSCAVSALGWWRERDHVVGATAWRLSIAGVAGMPMGIVVLTYASGPALSVVIALVVLLLVVALSIRMSLPTGPRTEVGVGVVAGALETSVGMNGPPLVLSLQGAGLAPRPFRGTLQAVFCAQGTIALVTLTALGHGDVSCVPLVLAGVTGVPLGWLVGDRAFARLSAEAFRRTVLIGLTATAMVSLAGAL